MKQKTRFGEESLSLIDGVRVLGTQDRGAGNEVQLTDALARQIGKVPFHGFRFSGERFDCGSKIGFLQANIAFAMSRDDLAEPLASWIKNRMALS